MKHVIIINLYLLLIATSCIVQKPMKQMLFNTTAQKDTTFVGFDLIHNQNCYAEDENFILSINRIDSNRLALRVSCKNNEGTFTYPFWLYDEKNTILIFNPDQQERYLHSFNPDIGYVENNPYRNSIILKENESIEQVYNFREQYFNVIEGGIEYNNMSLNDNAKKTNFFAKDGIYQLQWVVKYKDGSKEKEIKTPPFNYYYSLVPILFNREDF